MRNRANALVPDDDRPSLAVLLGLAEDEMEHGGRQVRRLAQVAALWPLAMAFQGLSAVTASVALMGSLAVLGLSALLVVTSLYAFAIVQMPASAWRSHLRARGATLLASVIGGALVTLQWMVVHDSDGMISQTAIVLATGALALSALALYPIRPAMIGYAAGMVLAMAPHMGLVSTVAGIATVLLILFTGTLRLVRLDRATTRADTVRAMEGAFAAKMIAEFEDQGTGWFWEVDRDGRIVYISARVADAIAGFGPAPLGRALTEVFHMDSATPATERTLAFHLSSRTSFSDYSVRAAQDDAGERWWSMSGRPVIDELGRFQGFIGSGTDLTERRRSEAEITRLALFDGLTGLANRQRMRLSIDKTLAQAQGGGRPNALFLMDLDRFKAVNDTLGHQAGDDLLKQVAQRLSRGVGDAGLVGRLGGDEFQVLLPGTQCRDTLATLATELIGALSMPYRLGGTSVTIGCSIGVAIAPYDGSDSETLIRNADLALYAAKADGRGVHRFYAEQMLEGARNRQALEEDLRQALANGAFHLCYQPVVSALDERIVGYEALVRWDHPTRGPVSPADFIPVAEECGLIEALGEWVLRTACLEAATWPEDVCVAVNVSPVQFANPQLPTIVTSALARSGLVPGRLELEITEGVFLDDTRSSDAMFRSLKALGVRLSLDDFGTGYSSLGYLRSAPFDKIKIDQSFVRGAAQPGSRNIAIIRAIVTLAETLGMETTAEGVEAQDEVLMIRDLGCSHIQGYVYGRPMRCTEAVAMLTARAGQAVATGVRVTRAERTKVFRPSRVSLDGVERDVRIRDISPGGAMIDGLTVDQAPIGVELLIELVENQMFAARICWAADGRAGLQFAQPLDLQRLLSTPARPLRRAM